MLTTELSTEARLLADRLAEVPQGDLISMADISAILGRDVTRCRHILYSAIRVVQRETGASFAVERGVGYRRLEAKDAPVTLGTAARASIRRKAKRTSTAIRAAVSHANSLPPDAVRRANAEISALGLLEHIARDRQIKEAEKTAERPITVAEAGKAFLARIGAIGTDGSTEGRAANA